MKLLSVFLLTMQIGISAFALETTIGGQRYSCEPIDNPTPKEEWFCSIDLSYHRGGVHNGTGATRSAAAAEAKSSCTASEEPVLRNLCVMPPQCESYTR
ncbi:hypothetical protein [Bdellovibrio sp. HCB337]|uniref:hypothetical protein n=1 Tax=Bdellovibrio sp. HCB337 TaxID=3394358 RepID=UPI0039A530A3